MSKEELAQDIRSADPRGVLGPEALAQKLHELGYSKPSAPKAVAVIRDTRSEVCKDLWPECRSGEYDPRCCRFPKSCSAGHVTILVEQEPFEE